VTSTVTPRNRTVNGTVTPTPTPGHSKKEGAFIYGCPIPNGACPPEWPGWMSAVLTRLFGLFMAEECPAFDCDSCTYSISRGKRNTGRVVVNQDLGVRGSVITIYGQYS